MKDNLLELRRKIWRHRSYASNLKQLRKPEKNSGLNGPMTSATLMPCSTNWAFQAIISELHKLCINTAMINHVAISYSAVPDSLGTLSNRRRRPDDGNRKRDISFETSLRMYNTLWPDVALKLRTWERGVSRRDENPSTSCFCFDPFSVLLCYFRAEPR